MWNLTKIKTVIAQMVEKNKAAKKQKLMGQPKKKQL